VYMELSKKSSNKHSHPLFKKFRKWESVQFTPIMLGKNTCNFWENFVKLSPWCRRR
jgi:hypothetical protein